MNASSKKKNIGYFPPDKTAFKVAKRAKLALTHDALNVATTTTAKTVIAKTYVFMFHL